MSEQNSLEAQRAFISIEHARLRPGMYVGSTFSSGLHQLSLIVLDDSIDEAMAGHCDHIWLTLKPNHEITIRNNGRGISTEIVRDQKTFLEVLMTETRIRRQDGDYQIQGGLLGCVTLYAVNALSTEYRVESAYEGFVWELVYKQGIPQSGLRQLRPLGEKEMSGRSITFRPDFSIFELHEFEYEFFAERACELAALVPGLTITLLDEREAAVQTDEYHFPNGLADFVVHLNRNEATLHEAFMERNEWTIQTKSRSFYGTPSLYTIKVEIAFQYTDSMETKVLGFINNLRTGGGFHTEIVPSAFVMGANDLIAYLRLFPFSIDEIMSGLTVVVRVIHPHPRYDSTRLPMLHNTDIAGIVADTICEAFRRLPYGDDKIEVFYQKWMGNRRILHDEG